MPGYTFQKKSTSSAIKNLYYNQDSKNLYIEFKNGNRAGYAGVDGSTFANFIAAKSHGRFYNDHIRGKNYKGINADGEFYKTTVGPKPPVASPATHTGDALGKVTAQVNVQYNVDDKPAGVSSSTPIVLKPKGLGAYIPADKRYVVTAKVVVNREVEWYTQAESVEDAIKKFNEASIEADSITITSVVKK